MATRLVFTPPCALKRVDGKWHALGAVEQLPMRWHTDADRAPAGELAGEGGRYAYHRGYRYEVTPEVAEAIADVRSTGRVNGRVRNVRLGDWIVEAEAPEPVTHRTHPVASVWTRGQQDYLDALEARLTKLEAALHVTEPV